MVDPAFAVWPNRLVIRHSVKNEERLDKLLDEDVGHYGKDFRQLQNGIIKCRDFLFTFLDHEGVPHHNNASEAAVRILKVKTKVSGGFRTQDGAEEYAVFHSITDTAKKDSPVLRH